MRYVAAGLPGAAASLGPTSVAVRVDYLFRYGQALSKLPVLSAAPASPVGVALLWVGVPGGRPAAVAEFGLPRDEITQKSTAR
jgi:hypothetical protein